MSIFVFGWAEQRLRRQQRSCEADRVWSVLSIVLHCVLPESFGGNAGLSVWLPLYISWAFSGSNGFNCMDRTLLFQLDMIPSAHQGLECGLQWEPGPVRDQNWGPTCIRPESGWASSPFRILPRQGCLILLLIRGAVQIIQCA